MIIDSGFAAKSGQGTSMYSRRGKSTINSYLCFNNNPLSSENKKLFMFLKGETDN